MKSSHVLDEAKRRLDLRAIILADYPDAMIKGGSFRAAWRNDRTASCTIARRDGIDLWHDKATGEGGTVVDYYVHVHGMTVRDAIATVLRDAGLADEPTIAAIPIRPVDMTPVRVDMVRRAQLCLAGACECRTRGQHPPDHEARMWTIIAMWGHLYPLGISEGLGRRERLDAWTA